MNNDLDSVRNELLERGDEMVSFRQLVERFDEVEETFHGEPWNLKQIYNNFNILIGSSEISDLNKKCAYLELCAEDAKSKDFGSGILFALEVLKNSGYSHAGASKKDRCMYCKEMFDLYCAKAKKNVTWEEFYSSPYKPDWCPGRTPSTEYHD